MKKCSLILFVLALSISFKGYSQIQVSIKSESGLPVPGAKVTCVSMVDSTQSLHYLSDSDGKFNFNASQDIYLVKVVAAGYDDYLRELRIESSFDIVLTKANSLNTVCVTAQYEPTNAHNAIQKITVISHEKIERSGAVNLGELLTYQTGMRISNQGILGSSMDLSGISGQNVKILIDGVPVIGRKNGNIDLSQINLNNVERIEIIEGPLSVNFGSNALAGTINIITKKSLPDGMTIEVNPYYESTGNYNFNITTGLNIKAHNVLINVGRNYFDGWSSTDRFIEFPKSRLADTNRFKTWKPKEQYFGEFHYNTAFKGWFITPYARYFKELVINRGFPIAPYYETAFDDYYNTKRTDVGITFNKKLRSSALKGQIAYNRYDRIKNTFYKDLTTLDQVLSETEGAQDTSLFYLINSRIIFQSIREKKLDYEFGVDINYEAATGRRILNNHQEIGDYAIFSTAEWTPFKTLIIKPGVRYAFNTVYAAPLVPSLNVRFRKKMFTVRGAVARGFRSPNLKELYFEFVDINHNIHGNTNLLSEDSWNYSFHFDWMKQTKKNLLVKLSYGSYFNDIKNLITLGMIDEGANYYSYLNIGKFKTFGNQISVDLRTEAFNFNLNAAYIGRYNIDAQTKDVPTFNFSPDIGSRLSYNLLKKRLFLNLFFKYNGKLQRFFLNENNEIETSTQRAYSILDFSASVHLLKKRNLHFTGGVKNLLNVQQVNVVGASQGTHNSGTTGLNAGRGISFFLSAKYTINYAFKKSKEE